LKLNNIKYIREYVVKIKNKNMRFDFYLVDLDILIEYDGIQHYQSVDLFGGDEYLKTVNYYDSLKNDWVRNNDKILIRISYKDDISIQLSKLLHKEQI
jgi:very-short-patch-repair endonuclease